MKTEHLSNLHPGWVLGGWAVAMAVTSGVYLALVGTGFVPSGEAGILWVTLAVAVGFFAGGFLVGMRWCDAPILHGAAITFFGVLVWFVGGLALPGRFGALAGSGQEVLGLVLIQFVAAVVGGWSGRRRVLGAGGGPG